ncbi:MAG TPA: hypothetical protein VFA00_06170 [Actinomycetota bacterium]|nr:hypothetical protein [Actinomycetota bacterium]
MSHSHPNPAPPSDPSQRPALTVVPESPEQCEHCARAEAPRSVVRRKLAGVVTSSLILVVLLLASGYFMFDGAGYPAALRARFVNSCGLPGACRCLLEHLETQGVPASSVQSFLEGDLSRSTSVFAEMNNGLFICGVAPGEEAQVSRTAAALRNAAAAEETFAEANGKFTHKVEDLVRTGLTVRGDIELEIVKAGYMSYCIEARHEMLDATYFLDSQRGAPAAGNC